MEDTVAHQEPPAVLVSAFEGVGVETLIELMEFSLREQTRTYEVRLSPNQGKERAWLYDKTHVVSERSEDCGDLIFTVQMDDAQLGQLQAGFSTVTVQRD